MSAFVAIADICNAVESTLSAAAGLARSQSYNELTEGMNDTPTLQVYPESGAQDIGTANDRTTFKAGVQQEEIVVNADVYVRQRSQIAEDMGALVTQLDAIRTVLKAQKEGDHFGLVGIRQFSWTWQRVIFEYGDPLLRYVGFRVIIRIRMY